MKDRYIKGFKYALKLRDPSYSISSNDLDGITTWTLLKGADVIIKASECCISNCDALGMIMRYLKNPASFDRTPEELEDLNGGGKKYSIFNNETKCINTWEKRQNTWQWLPIISGDDNV